MQKDGLRVLYDVFLGFLNKKRGARLIGKKNPVGLASVLALFLCGLSVSAWAYGLPRGGIGRLGLTSEVLGQVLFPCRSECRDTARDCSSAAEADAVSCTQTTCATEIETAQTACALDLSSQACKIAVVAVKTCGQSCLTTLQAAVSSCRDVLSDCLDMCGNT